MKTRGLDYDLAFTPRCVNAGQLEYNAGNRRKDCLMGNYALIGLAFLFFMVPGFQAFLTDFLAQLGVVLPF